jgi:hypothetical protein
MREGSSRSAKGTSGKLQATIFEKCDRTYHRPETNKGCASGTCQHTCEAAEIERCRHAWTVRYTVNGVQRDKSFRDEIDARKRVQYGSGLKKAQDFQLENPASPPARPGTARLHLRRHRPEALTGSRADSPAARDPGPGSAARPAHARARHRGAPGPRRRNPPATGGPGPTRNPRKEPR